MKNVNVRGTTLIEVLVAGVLVSLSAIGILGVFTSGYLIINKARILHRATELARDKIEELNNQAIEDVYPTGKGLLPVAGNGNVDEFDGYAETEDSSAPFLTANSNAGYLTSQKIVGQFIPGSDYVTFCPICGYANRGYLYTDWDDSNIGSCSATGLYIDSNDALDDNGPGALPDGWIQRKVTITPPCVYKIIPVMCQNKDLNGDGVEELAQIHGKADVNAKLQRPSQAGFFYRYIKVIPKRADSAYNNYTYQTSDVEGTLGAWQTFAGGPGAMRRTQSRSVPLKEVEVIIKWRAQAKDETFTLKTILSRLAPKYGY